MNENVEMGIVKAISMGCKLRDLAIPKSNKVNKILILSMGVIGDTVMMSQFYRNVRKNYPDAEIVVICKSIVKNMLETCPYIDRLVIFDRITDGKHKFERNVALIYRFVQNNFKNEIFDMAFTAGYFALSLEWLMLALIKSRKRFVYIGNTKVKNGIRITDTDCCCDHWKCHVVERNVFMLQHTGLKVFDDYIEAWTDDQDKAQAKALLERENIGKDKLILAVFPSTSAAFKDWPVDNYADVCRILLGKYSNLDIMLLGAGGNSQELGERFVRLVPEAHNLIGKTSVRESIELIRHSDLFLGGDTGTLHLSATAKLYGAVVVKDYAGAHAEFGSPMQNFGPWQAPITIVQPDAPLPGCEVQCDKMEAHCIKQVRVEQVVEAMEEAIDQRLKNGKLHYNGI